MPKGDYIKLQIPQEKVEGFVRILLAWAKNNIRNFPWRKTNDPYKVLIAEIMLQRTRANQVVAIYRDFILRYPSPYVLASAPLEDIKRSIQSLGLEKRAQGLKRLAEQLVADHGGRIPKNKEELLRLHGVGNYISNAVLCYSFGVDVPTVDVNFARVLKRVFSLQTKEPSQKDKRVWLFARDLMLYEPNHSRKINLGVIDLASLICTARNPKCSKCSLNSICNYALRRAK